MIGDSANNKKGVRGDYSPTKTPPNIAAIKGKLQPARMNLLMSAAKIKKFAPSPTNPADAKLKRRKKTARNLSLAGAAVGAAALGSKGAEGVLRLRKMPAMADKVSMHTNNALVLGTGVGAAGALNSAAIANTEAKSKKALVKGLGVGARHSSTLIRGGTLNPTSVLNGNGRSNEPKAKTSIRNAGKMISTGRSPDPMIFATGMPGGKALRSVYGGVNKGFRSGLKEGARIAGTVTPAGRGSARAGSATDIMGRKTGAATHDFKAGYSRHIHSTPDIEAGKVTTRANAAYPGWHKAGHLTRKATPFAVVGTTAVVGSKAGYNHQRKKQTVTKSEGVLMPISKRSAYDSERDRHARNSLQGGVLAAGAVGAGAYGASQVRRAAQHIKVNPERVPNPAFNANTPKKQQSGKLIPKTVKGSKMASVNISRAGLKSGGRAAGALVAAGGLATAASRVAHKQKRNSDWY